MLSMLYKAITPWATANKIQIIRNRIIGRIANLIYPTYCKILPGKIEVGGSNNPALIVSLTSFPARIDKVYLCIESILRQTKRADRIILWLAKSDFPNEEMLPGSLTKLKHRGLEIRYCEDIKSYKKIFFTAQIFPKEILITADDDVLYPEDWIDGLVVSHQKYKNCVCCYRAAQMVLGEDGKIKPYREWKGLSKGITGPSHLLLATGVGGVLYPPGFFSKAVFDFEIIRELCPTADDMWLKALSVLQGYKVVKVHKDSKEWFTIVSSQKHTLTSCNVGNNINDVALQNLISYYNLDFAQYID